uniref:hypothetical protein n=1 Tax=uncultured Draconibacterium sp. TaxID=1573823 RepID=UPI0032176CAB
MNKLKNIAPELSKLKKEVPFSTPKNYFDDFSARMQTRIQTEKQAEKEPEQKTKIIQLLKPFIGLAASFALIFLLVYVPLKTFIKKEVTEVAQTSEYSDSDFIDVMEELDENSFFALLNEEAEAENDLSKDDLRLFVSANFTDYEIFEFTEN